MFSGDSELNELEKLIGGESAGGVRGLQNIAGYFSPVVKEFRFPKRKMIDQKIKTEDLLPASELSAGFLPACTLRLEGCPLREVDQV